MDDRRSLKRILRNPLVSLLGGFALAGLGVGVALLILVYFIEPLSSPETRNTVNYRSENFLLWYQKDSPARDGHEELALVLERELSDLIALLEVDRKLIPTPIDVFVHDDTSAMQNSILLRKSAEARATYRAPLDLRVGEEPRARLVELVLAFGWGRCGSQILQIGARLYAIEPERNFHAVLAALPERLFLTLPELIRLEEEGRLPSTLYQRFDSPYSPAMAHSLGDLKSLLEIPTVGKESPEDFRTLETASFVQFLIETKDGIRVLKHAWGVGTTEKLLKQVDLPSPTQLGLAWRKAAMERGKDSPDLDYLRAYYLLGSGDPDAAYAQTRQWSLDALSEAELLLAGRCALAVGAFTEAAQLAKQLGSKETRAKLEGYLALYEGWSVTETQGLRILAAEGPTGSLEELLATLQQAYTSIATRLGLSRADLAARTTLFLYPDAASRDSGASLTPLSSAQSATLHLLQTDDLPYRLGEVLPTYGWQKETYSKLLRTGLAVALSRSEELLTTQGCQLRHEGRWCSLPIVSFGTADPETVEVEAGLLVHYLLKTFGPQDVRAIWAATSPLDRYLSVDTALEEVCGITRRQIEDSLFSSFLHCD